MRQISDSLRRGASILKVSVLTMFIALISFSISAENQEAYSFIVRLKNGEKKAFVLAEKPVVTFSGQECIIELGGYTSIFNMAEIDFANFGDGSSGISDPVGDMVFLDLSDPATAVVRGLEKGTSVTVYTLNGMLIQSSLGDDSGECYIDLSQIAPGTVFFISINNIKTFKLYKK